MASPDGNGVNAAISEQSVDNTTPAFVPELLSVVPTTGVPPAETSVELTAPDATAAATNLAPPPGLTASSSSA